MRRLRDYQQDAVTAAHADWAAGILRTTAVLATGLGKTSIIGRLATDEAARGGTVLVLAHRAKLLEQITGTCREFRPDIPVGRVQADTDQRGMPIVAAMTPTMASAARRARWGRRRPTLVIYDECHHAPAPGNRAILEWAGCYDGTRAFGVTATLVRGDKYKPSTVWQSVALERDIVWGVTHGPSADDPWVSVPVEPGQVGWLVPPRARVVIADHLDLKAAKSSRGDYQSGDLGEMVEQDVDQIVKAWSEHAPDRLTVAFTPNVASATALRDEFMSAGIAAGLVVGTMPESVRDRVYADLAAGRVRVLVSVMVPTEGWDCPPVSCVLNARPTKLPGLYAQMIGRGLRTSPGKRDCLVLDVVGASRGQRLVGLTDLSPAFVRDTSELDDLPCERCGGILGQDPLDPDLLGCSCTCQGCMKHQFRCGCDRSGAGAGPQRTRLQGPARYEDIDLIGATGTFRWQRSLRGVPFLIGSSPQCHDRAAILYPDTRRVDSPTWTPGHVAVRGPHAWVQLDPGVPHTFAQAQEVAQRWAGPSPSRRGGAVEEWMLGKAAALGVPNASALDRRALLAAIDVARVSQVVDK